MTQAAQDHRADQLQSQLAQLECALAERFAQAQASASASGAQLRSQLALRHSELGAANVEQIQRLQDRLQQLHAESNLQAGEQIQKLENLLTERLTQSMASFSTSDAQLRSQLALRHSELEAANVEQIQRLQDRLQQLHEESNSQTSEQVQKIENLLTERLAQSQASMSASDAQLRSQMALRHSEMQTLWSEQSEWLQHHLTQQLTLVGQGAIDLDANLRIELAKNAENLEKLVSEMVAHLVQLQTGLDRPLTSMSDPAITTEQRRRMDRLQIDLDFVKNHMSSYLGSGTGLTHLVDETPIYVNTNDFGCPSNFINGGRYEEEYYQVLASFRRPDSVFLDIGANLGVFSLRLAPLLRKGRVYAFEPNDQIYALLARSIHLNGLKERVEVFKFGVSDQNAQLALAVPEGHAGGASVYQIDENYTGPRIEVHRIDDVLANLPRFDLAKIDVEGHELHALRGMAELLERSTDAVILFEKLNANSGIEGSLIKFFANYQMGVYRIDGVTLVEVNQEQFSSSEAYFLAARASTIGDAMCRNFINLFPDDLYAIACRVMGSALVANAELPANSLIFHGPYWYLPRGSYRLAIIGKVDAGFKLVIAEKFGFSIAEFAVSSDCQTFEFIVENDLTHFEVVGRAADQGAVKFSIKNICLTRLG
jgi:FkbM family methyltransferase